MLFKKIKTTKPTKIQVSPVVSERWSGKEIFLKVLSVVYIHSVIEHIQENCDWGSLKNVKISQNDGNTREDLL